MVNTKTTSVKGFYSDLPAWVKLVIILIIAIVVFFIIRYLVKKYNESKRNKLLNKGPVTGIGEQSGAPISIDLGGKAAAIHDAFHGYFWGMAEDEERAILEISAVPKNVIPDLSALYYQLYQKNLKQEFIDYLSATDWNRVKDKFN